MIAKNDTSAYSDAYKRRKKTKNDVIQRRKKTNVDALMCLVKTINSATISVAN